MLLEKAARDKKGVEEKKAAEEIEELQNKVENSHSLWTRSCVVASEITFLPSSS